MFRAGTDNTGGELRLLPRRGAGEPGQEGDGAADLPAELAPGDDRPR
jgi:hypothetical protein